MKRRTKFFAAAAAAVLAAVLFVGSALAYPMDGAAESADDLWNELNDIADSKTIVLRADIDYYDAIILINKNYTFDLNGHILNIIEAPLLAIDSILSLQGEGELNIDNSVYPLGVMVLNSNITVTNITSEVGVVAYESIVTVDGEISSPTYIVADGLLKEKDDGVAGTGPDAGYMLYTSGESTIRVKIPRNKTYTVSYHPNGALCEAPADMNRYCRGDKVTLADGKGLLNPGYEFAGWELADGTLVTEPFIMGESDVTLYARWN